MVGTILFVGTGNAIGNLSGIGLYSINNIAIALVFITFQKNRHCGVLANDVGQVGKRRLDSFNFTAGCIVSIKTSFPTTHILFLNKILDRGKTFQECVLVDHGSTIFELGGQRIAVRLLHSGEVSTGIVKSVFRQCLGGLLYCLIQISHNLAHLVGHGEMSVKLGHSSVCLVL